MTSELLVHIGALCFRLTGQLPDFAEDSYVRRFSLSAGRADVSVELSRPERLTSPEGVLRREESATSVFETADAFVYYFRDARPPLGFDYARLFAPKADPDRLQLQILRDVYPYVEGAVLSYLAAERQLHRHGQTILHASWVLRDGGSILFSGPSGVGKSTQAELWREFRGCEIVNGDKAAIRFRPGGADAVGLPYCGSSPHCLDRTAPIRAVVLLEQAPQNAIRRVRLAEAVRLLSAQMPAQRWCAEDVADVLALSERLAAAVPVWLLRCTKDEGAVALLEKTLAEEDAHAAG